MGAGGTANADLASGLAQGGISRLELDDFDNLLVRNEFHEPPVVRVGVRGRLASPSVRVVRERDSVRSTFAGVERMYVTGHAGRHLPRCNRTRMEKRTIDDLAGFLNVLINAG